MRSSLAKCVVVTMLVFVLGAHWAFLQSVAWVGMVVTYSCNAPLTEALFVSGFANYSTAFDSFNVSAKLAYKVSDWVSVGPQAAVLGCEGFDQVRAGLASAFRIGDGIELAPSAGAAWKLDENDYGFYGALNLYARF